MRRRRAFTPLGIHTPLVSPLVSSEECGVPRSPSEVTRASVAKLSSLAGNLAPRVVAAPLIGAPGYWSVNAEWRISGGFRTRQTCPPSNQLRAQLGRFRSA